MLNPISILFDIKGPKGSFGQLYFSSLNETISKKKPIKINNKNCIKIGIEKNNYINVYQCIEELGLKHIKTIRVKSNPSDNCSFILQRMYPPLYYDKLIQLDYSVINDGLEIDNWEMLSPKYIKETNLLKSIDVDKNIPFELGCLWMNMVIKYRKVIWEPELFISRLMVNKSLDTQNDLFIVDFDKLENVTDDEMKYVGKIPIYHFLTNVFPTPNSLYFEYFSNGILEIAKKCNKIKLGHFVLEGIKKIL